MLTKTLLLCLGSLAAYSSPLSVRLLPNLPSPQPVGTVISLTPRLDGAKPGMYVFRYQVKTGTGSFRVVRDFSQDSHFSWSPELCEQDATIRVTVRKNGSDETTEADLPFRITPRQVGSNGTVTPTANPLVALLSAPGCPQGSQFRAAFRRQGDESLSHTSLQACRADKTNNVYVAGMRADTAYEIRAETIKDGNVTVCEWIPFHTGILDGGFPRVTGSIKQPGKVSEAEGIVIRSLVSEPWRSTATDLDGNVLWYLKSDGPAFLTRVLPEGHFLVLADGSNSANDMKRLQLLREVDLLGGIVRETNISLVAEQLRSRGIKSECKSGGQECVSGFHHEAIRLQNGHTIVLAGLERMFPAGTQGAKERVDILGDLILDLDENFQLAWTWNSFDHLDLKRAGLGKGTCKGGPGGDGCTPVFLAEQANEWLHSNSLYYMPQSGDLLLSIPEQDWVVKIDYRDGKGNGDVVWKLGEGGDFTAKATDPHPWFSYQHDVGFESETNLLLLFDDGHRRKDKDPKANNRGQTWKLDEKTRTATLMLNADMGLYSMAVGSAQSLSNGGYSFESGLIFSGPPGLGAEISQTTETSPDGKIVYTQQVDDAITYRSFLVPDMYTAPRK
jgi:hypothetical protein